MRCVIFYTPMLQVPLLRCDRGDLLVLHLPGHPLVAADGHVFPGTLPAEIRDVQLMRSRAVDQVGLLRFQLGEVSGLDFVRHPLVAGDERVFPVALSAEVNDVDVFVRWLASPVTCARGSCLCGYQGHAASNATDNAVDQMVRHPVARAGGSIFELVQNQDYKCHIHNHQY